MPLAKLRIPPGVFANGTEYQSQGRWFDVDQVRWQNGIMRPIGGWISASATTLDGVCRGGIAWRRNDGNRFAGLGTTEKLYAFKGGSLFDITPVGYTTGRVDSITGFGYGYGPYGAGAYGTSRPSSQPLAATTWSLDTWGDFLVGVASHEGIIYEWQGVTTTPAAAIANAPTARALVTTEERSLVALGAGGDVRKVQWSDREDNTVWTPATTNTAGDFLLTTDGAIRTAVKVRGQILILTTVDAHTMRFIGSPFYYSFEKVGRNNGIVGPLAVATFAGAAMWMGARNFYLFDGRVSTVQSEVNDYVFDNINETQLDKVVASHHPRFNEIRWAYPSAGSTEIDRYVIYNYREDHWSIGTLERTTWVTEGVFENPLATDASGNIYEHDNGWTNAGTTRVNDIYAQSGPIEIGNGERFFRANQLIPDELTQGEVQISFAGRVTPNSPEFTAGPYQLIPYTPIRVNARQISMRVEPVVDDDWRVGDQRLKGFPGARR